MVGGWCGSVFSEEVVANYLGAGKKRDPNHAVDSAIRARATGCYGSVVQ